MRFLDEFAFKGMKVIVQMDSDMRGHSGKELPDGATGTLVERKVFQRHSSRYGIDRYFKEPGLYEQLGTWIVKMDDPSFGDIKLDGQPTGLRLGTSYFRVHPDHFVEYENRKQQFSELTDFHEQNIVLNGLKKIGELPESKAWELDEIVFNDEHIRYRDDEHKLRYVVSSIDYQEDNLYSVMALDENGEHHFGTNVRESQILGIKRGNVWKMENGVPLEFSSLEEEGGFYRGIGRAREMKNPKLGIYRWSLEDFLEAVKDDVVDCMTNGFAPFSNQRRISAYRYLDRDIGERLRQATIAGFNIDLADNDGPKL